MAGKSDLEKLDGSDAETAHVQASFFTKEERYDAWRVWSWSGRNLLLVWFLLLYALCWLGNVCYPFCSRYAVPETPFSIPVIVTREELTTLINQLLEGEIYFKTSPTPLNYLRKLAACEFTRQLSVLVPSHFWKLQGINRGCYLLLITFVNLCLLLAMLQL